jgi:hypothetical protein
MDNSRESTVALLPRPSVGGWWRLKSISIVFGMVLLMMNLGSPALALAQGSECRCRVALDRIEYRGQRIGQRFIFQATVNSYPDGAEPLQEVTTDFPRPHEDPVGDGVIFPLLRGNEFPVIDDPATDGDERLLIDRTFVNTADADVVITLAGSGTEFDAPPRVNDRGELSGQAFVLRCQGLVTKEIAIPVLFVETDDNADRSQGGSAVNNITRMTFIFHILLEGQ